MSRREQPQNDPFYGVVYYTASEKLDFLSYKTYSN